MPRVRPSQTTNPGPKTDLHRYTFLAHYQYTAELLASGSVDIDGGDPDGYTALMYAAQQGEVVIAKLLLSKGANPSIGNADGFTPTILAVNIGHVAIAKMLAEAGADLEAPLYNAGLTALYIAVHGGGHKSLEMVRALIEGGANPNNRTFGGSTPLFAAAVMGRLEAVKMLLHAGASASLANETTGATYVPLEAAASHGHLEVVRELIQHAGIENCGGTSGGIDALEYATHNHHVEIMATLTAAGVADTGEILNGAAKRGQETWVRNLLQQKRNTTSRSAYVNNTCDSLGRTALLFACGFEGFPNPRIARMLVDAGADTTSPVLLRAEEGRVAYNDTPLTYTTRLLRWKIVFTEEDELGDATEEQLHRLEAIRRLLLRVEAVRSVCWLWPRDVHSSIAQAVASRSKTEMTSAPLISTSPICRKKAERHDELMARVLGWVMYFVSWLWLRNGLSIAQDAESKSKTKVISTPLGSMSPISRRRTRRRGVIWAAVLRYSHKP
ncbi:unnamed protein product [Pylaiella littoralis]